MIFFFFRGRGEGDVSGDEQLDDVLISGAEEGASGDNASAWIGRVREIVASSYMVEINIRVLTQNEAGTYGGEGRQSRGLRRTTTSR